MNLDMETMHLKPCEIAFPQTPALVGTVLGSCVSVTMYSPEMKRGCICHAMLPYSVQEISRSETCFKYLDCSIIHMNKLMTTEGVSPEKTVVKVFGGADMYETNRSSATVGVQNIRAAHDLLGRMGYTITAEDTGGSFGRKIYFNSETGKVYMRKVKKTEGIAI